MKIEDVKYIDIEDTKTIVVYLDTNIKNNSLLIVIQRANDKMSVDKQLWEIQINNEFLRDIKTDFDEKIKFVNTREFIDKSILTFQIVKS